MKHLKTFEKFEEINEISGAMVNRATDKAYDIARRSDDSVTSTIKFRQRSKFSGYINPNIKKIAQNFGFDIYKDENTFVVKLDNSTMAYIDVNGKISNELDTTKVETNTLRKLQRLANAIKQDNTESNEL